mgnify:CR=1 FL=1
MTLQQDMPTPQALHEAPRAMQKPGCAGPPAGAVLARAKMECGNYAIRIARVAIARAIVNQPKVLFADEPTGNLDSRNSAEIMGILMDLATEHGVTLVVVTHDPALAAAGDRTLVIRDGSIREEA